MNRFLLCTLVCEAARAIKAQAELNGAGASSPMIARNVLRTYLMGAANRPDAALEPDTGISELLHNSGPLNEEEMFRAIELQLQAVLKQAQTLRADERRLDIETIAIAVETRRKT